jgi:ribosome-binding protein aMBF1 (putative translation factor)
VPKIPGIDPKVAAFVASVRDQLRQAREGRGWTRAELSQEAAWVSLHLLERYERGDVDLEVFEFQQVCSALDLDATEVLDQADRAAESTPEK